MFSRMDMSEYAEPSPTELEQIVDEARREAGQGPAPRSAGTGIADMKARIEYHTTLRAKLVAQLESANQHRRDDLLVLVNSCDRQLDEAQTRLRDFELLNQSQN